MRRAVQTDRAQLAELLGVSQARIGQLETEGWIKPDAVQGRRKQYDLGAVMRTFYSKALMARRDGEGEGLNPNEARARKDTAQAEISELNLKRQLGTMLDAGEVLGANGKVVSAVRAKILMIPTVWPDRITRAAKATGASGVENILKVAVDEVLTELSSMKVSDVLRRPTRRKRKARVRKAKK